MNKTLVVYYSHSGNTKTVGNLIGNVLNADVLEITPVERYTGGMWDVVDQWRVEHENNILRDINEYDVNLNDYDNILLGSPNWGGTIATPLITFISQNNFEGKRVIPFITHGGGGKGRMDQVIFSLTKAADTVKPLVITANHVNESMIENWAEEIGLYVR